MANWDQTGEALIQRVHREAVGNVPDPETAGLLDEVLSQDVTLQEIRIESFFPADVRTERHRWGHGTSAQR